MLKTAKCICVLHKKGFVLSIPQLAKDYTQSVGEKSVSEGTSRTACIKIGA